MPPCSSRLAQCHYSFDFAQQVHFPTNPLQPGPVYFKSTRKCGIFGIMCEGVKEQLNFLIDESVDTGKGANAVISMLHFFFEFYGLGEKSVLLHADNCSGQNKNTIMFWYLMWCVLTGRHSSIRLSFLIAGHTKFAPDWAFGLAKKRLRVTKVDCLDDIALAISTSSIVNRVQLVGHEDGSVCVPTYDWAGFLGNIFEFHQLDHTTTSYFPMSAIVFC